MSIKFWFGAILGALAGSYLTSAMTQSQRDSVAARARAVTDRARNSTVGSSIADNAAAVNDAAQQRASDVLDTAGEAVADTIAPDAGGTHTATV